MVKNFLDWLGRLERKNTFSFSLVIFLFLFVVQFVLQLVFSAEELFSSFWASIERMAFFSLGGGLVMFYFAARKKIER